MSLTLKKRFNKTTLGLALGSIFATTSVSAGSCDFDMEYDINLKGGAIELKHNEQPSVTISKDNQLYLKGEKQSLNNSQHELLSVYANDIRALVPAVSEVADEAAGLVQEAVTNVSEVLLADDPQKAENLAQRVNKITQGIRAHVSANHLRPNELESYFEDKEFEQELSALIEETVEDFVKGNIADIVAAAMSGDEEKVKAFETKMENFGKNMETKFEAKAELIEEKAEALCDLVEQIETNEDAFIKSFAEYEDYQLVTD